MDVDDERIAWQHSNPSMVSQKNYQTIAGYPKGMAAKLLNEDPVFTQALEKEALASQSSLSRLYNRINENTIPSLGKANQVLLDSIHQARKSEDLIIDLDSTHADTYGKQGNSAYNAYYNTVGYHPLVAFDGITGDFFKAQLRPGNVYTSNGAVEFTKPIIEYYNQTFPSTTLMVRGDSGFAIPGLYELCEKEDVYYIIRLKSNKILVKMADELRGTLPRTTDFSECEEYVGEIMYQANSWKKARRVIVHSGRAVGELLFTHTFFVTNFSENTVPEPIIAGYKKRGAMENFIKEAKNGFGFDRMNSSSLKVNEMKMMIGVLAYDFANWFRTLSFPPKSKKMQIETIRTRVIKVADKLVKSGRRRYFKLSSSFVYQDFLWNVLEKVQRIKVS